MKNLKLMALGLASLLIVFETTAQKNKLPSPRTQVTEKVGDVTVTIDYSRPSKRGRVIYGDLVKYGKVWRTGANESSWIEVSKDVKIAGQPLAAGKYGLFTIPGEDEWTIIFNKVWKGWGSYNYEESDDVLRVNITPKKLAEEIEKFTISLDKKGMVNMLWDKTQVSFTIN